jgi:hypothetical protein
VVKGYHKHILRDQGVADRDASGALSAGGGVIAMALSARPGTSFAGML